jgi:hypothetical protein
MSQQNKAEKHVGFAEGAEEIADDHHERTALFQNKKNVAPNDDNNLAYYIFFLLGIGSLLPWNSFITASAYLRARFVEQTTFGISRHSLVFPTASRRKFPWHLS